jgi:Xaa-Pro aminopeptidase
MNEAARAEEVAFKMNSVQKLLGERRAARLRGTDWFAWMTAGGSNAVLLAAETGTAEVLVTPRGTWVLTDEIEAQRLVDEQLPQRFPVRATAWAHPAEREALVQDLTQGCQIVSDRPLPSEAPLPAEMVMAKRKLTAPEIERYRMVGELAAQAMTEALQQATPEWSEGRLAGAGASAMIARGLDPGLIMAAGERRLQLYRHPVTAADRLGSMAMMVFCARGRGLYANLTRFVSFGRLEPRFAELHEQVREVESQALAISRPGVRLSTIYDGIAKAYAAAGHEAAIREHHQGGTTGYLSREIIARPDTGEELAAGNAVAWNPSLRGAKVEDTFLVTDSGLVNLTMDPLWPKTTVAGQERPLVLER